MDHSAASRSTAVALKAVMDLGSPMFAQARASMVETIGRLMTAAVATGAIRSDVTPETVFRAMGGICASHDQPGWEADAQAVVRLLFGGLRHTATAPLRTLPTAPAARTGSPAQSPSGEATRARRPLRAASRPRSAPRTVGRARRRGPIGGRATRVHRPRSGDHRALAPPAQQAGVGADRFQTSHSVHGRLEACVLDDHHRDGFQ
ncbi:hypothetical protein HEP87_58150 [Streptomyces sp. S1D4-11]